MNGPGPEAEMAAPERIGARVNPACVVCGARNSKGLQLRFRQESGEVCADWVPAEGWESFQGTIHGGIVSTVLDEAMSQAVIANGWEARTAELQVRFRGRVSPGDRLQVRGWTVERKRRRILAEATLQTTQGTECAHAWATFLVPPQN